MSNDDRPEREPVTFRVTVPRWDDTGTREDVCFVEPGGTMTKALTRAEMRDLATTLLDHLGQNYICPDSLDAEVIRAAGAWVDSVNKSASEEIVPWEMADAITAYRAGVSTK